MGLSRPSGTTHNKPLAHPLLRWIAEQAPAFYRESATDLNRAGSTQPHEDLPSLPPCLFRASRLKCAALLIAASGGWRDSRAAPPEGFSFRAVTAATSTQVQAIGPSAIYPQDVEASPIKARSRRVRIYRHRVGANIHYGAVVTPMHARQSCPSW